MNNIDDIQITIANLLYKWSGCKQIGGSGYDILTWKSEREYIGENLPIYCFAIRNNAEKIQKTFTYDSLPLNNYMCSSDVELQNIFGFSAKLILGKYLTSIEGGLGQTMSCDRGVGIDEIVPTIRDIIGEYLKKAFKNADSHDGQIIKRRINFTFIPSGGEPWKEGSDITPYYSVKKKKILYSKKPIGLVTLPSSKYGLDFCKYINTIEVTNGDYVNKNSLVLTNCTSTYKKDYNLSNTAGAINRCGGMLFPSLALSNNPATNFGSLVFVCFTQLATRIFTDKKWPVVIYNTDAWTDDGRAVESNSIKYYKQMTGNWIPEGNSIIHALGLEIKKTIPFFEEVDIEVIKTERKLAQRAKVISNMWKKNATSEELDILSSQYNINKYSYMEVKPNCIVSLSSFPIAIYPKSHTRVDGYLDSIGYVGKRIALELSDGILEGIDKHDSGSNWKYSWIVRDVIEGENR